MYVTPRTMSAKERELLFSYEYSSRTRLLRLCGRFFGVAFLLGALGIAGGLLINHPTAETPFIASVPIIFLMAICCGIGVWLVEHQQIEWSAVFIGGSGTLGTALFHLLWIVRQGFDPIGLLSFGAYPALIVFAGLLGNYRFVVIEASATSAITVGLFMLLAHHEPTLSPMVVIIPLVQQLSMILLIGASGYLRALRQLGVERVANERARQVDDIKTQFISIVNHELRTPATAVMGLLDLLADTPMPEQQRQHLILHARGAAVDFVELIQSILEIQQIDQETEATAIASIPLLAAVKTAANLVALDGSPTAERALHLLIAPDLAVWGHEQHLRQVFINLLSNGIKYSAPGTPIEVHAQVLSPTGGRRRREAEVAPTTPMVEITVRDYGLGVPPEQAPLLFQRFVRLPRDLQSTVMGNGLGLYLCRTYIEAMGGTIWLESTGVPGEGTTFFIHLPVAQG